MNKLRSKIALAKVAIALSLTTGALAACGGGNGGNDSSSSPPQSSQPFVSLFAGQIDKPGSAGGAAASAQFVAPYGMVSDSAGNIYVADNGGYTISKISNGVVTSLAGSPNQQGSADGVGAAASFEGPLEMAVDPSGNLYVTDSVANSDAQVIRKITPSGQVSTIIDPATGQALLTDDSPGIAVDAQSNVYVFTTNATNGASQLTQITPSGAINVVTLENASGAPIGLVNPQYLVIDASNNFYISDDDVAGAAGALYRVSVSGATGKAALMAGSVTATGTNDGPGNTATFDGLANLAIDGAGNIFANDFGSGTIREISSAGVVTTAAGISGQSSLALGTLPQSLPVIDALLMIGQTLYVSAPNDSVVLQISPLA
ncbi:hypothetical protein QZM22_00735 [Burkholderia oklahomensis]|uniref:hypothetical protein n=1 Tax=Burkholderia oklahomensis TaxID=342113 RepID=UPI00264EA24C|nr:hypothetical protein [Burkholderia oklahomensis]MDN7671086.1 hypothetical protein [Burkholderia oklahomensis]